MAIKGYLVNNIVHQEVDFFKSQKEAWIKAFKKLGVSLKFSDNFHALESIKKDHPDFVLFYDKDISLIYEILNLNIPVFNNVDAIRLCDDKAFTYSMLVKRHVNTPRTVVMPITFYHNGVEYFNIIKELINKNKIKYPMVVKDRCNSLGLGVYLVNNDKELKGTLKKHWDKQLLVQQYIGYEFGVDYRVFLAGHKPIVAFTRKNTKDFRSNVYQGGKVSIINKPDKQLLDIAVKASKALKLDFGAIDIVKDKNNKYYVLEVNSNARTATVDKLSKKSLTLEIAKYILSKLN